MKPSPTWSGDPDHPESNADHGLRVANACNTALKYRAFSCDADAVRENVHGFSFFIAERLGFTTVICDEIAGVDTSKRLVEYPIASAYRQGEFTVFLSEGFAEYATYLCKCRDQECATRAKAAYDELDQLTHLLPLDAPSSEKEKQIAASKARYARCEARFLSKPATTTKREQRKPRRQAKPTEPPRTLSTAEIADTPLFKAGSSTTGGLADPFEEPPAK